jgi:hypothetical protein
VEQEDKKASARRKASRFSKWIERKESRARERLFEDMI